MAPQEHFFGLNLRGKTNGFIDCDYLKTKKLLRFFSEAKAKKFASLILAP